MRACAGPQRVIPSGILSRTSHRLHRRDAKIAFLFGGDAMKWFAIPLLLACSAANATVACGKGVAHDEVECATLNETGKVDRKIAVLYKRLLADLTRGEAAQDKDAPYLADAKKEFVKGQQLWKKMIDADCQAVFHRELDGRDRFTIQAQCLLTHKKRRVEYLESFESGHW
jgi:uncharacterized protein YecT (DUF1311 family)